MSDRLRAYCDRLSLTAVPPATAEGLAVLQAAHRQAIPFENLDVPLGRGIQITSDAVFAKLVERGRGGYCFEQNRLFADMLAEIGITSRPLLARVRLAIPEGTIPPRTHVLLLADIAGEQWIADVGFGASYVPPLRLIDGEQVTTPDGAHHRLCHVGGPDGEWLLERAGLSVTSDGRQADHADWQVQYSFDLAHVEQADLDQANHWTSTLAGSRFVTNAIVTRVLPTGFIGLTGTKLGIATGGKSERREIANVDEWRAVLSEHFSLHLSADEVAGLPIFGT